MDEKLDQVADLDALREGEAAERALLLDERRALDQLKARALELVVKIYFVRGADDAPDGAAAVVDRSVFIPFDGGPRSVSKISQ
jgi:hypothetical protein